MSKFDATRIEAIRTMIKEGRGEDAVYAATRYACEIVNNEDDVKEMTKSFSLGKITQEDFLGTCQRWKEHVRKEILEEAIKE